MFNRSHIISGGTEKSLDVRPIQSKDIVSDNHFQHSGFLSKVPGVLFSMVLLLMFYHGFANPMSETYVAGEDNSETQISSTIGQIPFTNDVITEVDHRFNVELVYESEVEDEDWSSKKSKRVVRFDLVPFYSIFGKFELFQTSLKPDHNVTGVFRRISKNVLLRVFRL